MYVCVKTLVDHQLEAADRKLVNYSNYSYIERRSNLRPENVFLK